MSGPRRTGKRFWPGVKGPWRRLSPKAVFGEVSTGTASITEDNQTLSATGSVLVVGTANLTQADQTLSAAGGVLVVGTAALTQADQVLAATGGPTVAGIAALIQDSQILVATGTVVPPPAIGTFNGVQDNEVLSATGIVFTPPPPVVPRIPGLEWQRFDEDPTVKVGWR